MADFDYSVVISGINEAIAGLNTMNKALGLAEKGAEKHQDALNALSGQINEVAKMFGKQEAAAKAALHGMVDQTATVTGAAARLAAVQETLNRSKRAGGDADRIASTGMKKINAILKEQAEAIELATAAQTKNNKAIADPTPISKYQRYLDQANDAQNNAVEISIANQKALDNIKNKKDKRNADTNTPAIEKQINDRLENEKRLAEAALETDDAAFNARVKHIQDIESAFAKAADRQVEADNRVLLEKAKFYKRELKEFSLAEDSKTRIAKKSFDEQLRLARTFLEFEQNIKNGKTKSSVKNMNVGAFNDIVSGEEIVRQSDIDKTTQLSQAIQSVRGNLNQASDAQKRYAEASQKSEKNIREFTLSWQTMGRIIVAQLFNEAFFAIQNGIRRSVDEAEEFYKAIAEIQTIVSSTSRGIYEFNTALAGVLALSSKVNFTPQDTANAFYETLSNQIGDNVGQIKAFIQEAANLGKVTRATLADSSDAITAVLNSYNLGIEKTHEVSAQLFTLVDQGRVKLEEVANHMGNVSVPAAQLGIVFGDVVASLSAISIAGIPAREAMTLQRNVMFKLIEPTETMTELFDKWGVSSAQTAIATFGFTGVLKKLDEELENGNAHLADAFGSIRAYRGAVGQIGANLEKFTKAQEALTNAQETYDKAVTEYLTNPGEKFSKLMQQTSNEILEVGLRIVELVSYFGDLLGTAEDGTSRFSILIGILAKLGIIATATAGTFLVLASAFTAVAGASSLMSAALAIGLGPVGIAVSAIAATIVGLTVRFAAFSESSERAFGEMAAKVAEANKNVGESIRKGLIEPLKLVSDKSIANAKIAMVELAEAITDVDEAAKKTQSNKAIDDLAASLDRMINALAGDDAAQRINFILGNLEEINRVFQGDNRSTEFINDEIDAYDEKANAIQRVIDKLKAERDQVLSTMAANRIALAESVTERNIDAINNPRQRGQAQLNAAVGAANAATNSQDLEESKRLFETARRFLADAERTAFESGTFGTIENHTRFFNEQETQLYAMQERRLEAQRQFIQGQGEAAQQQLDEQNNSKTILENEIARRENLESQYKLEKAYLEELQRLQEQIRLDDQLSDDSKKEKLSKLLSDAERGLDTIGASPETRATIQAKIDSDRATLNSDIAKATAERAEKAQRDLAEATLASERATDDLVNSLRGLATDAEVAARRLGQVLPKIKTTEPNLIAGPDQFSQIEIQDPRVNQVLAELAKITAEEKERKLNPDQYIARLTTVLDQLYNIMATSPVRDDALSSTLAKISAELTIAKANKGTVDAQIIATNNLRVSIENLTAVIREQAEFLMDQAQATAASSELEESPANDPRYRIEANNSGSAEREGEDQIKSDADLIIAFLDPKFDKLFNIIALSQKEQVQQTAQVQQQQQQNSQQQNNQQQNNQQSNQQAPLQQSNKSRGQLIYEEQQNRIAGFMNDKSRGQKIYEEQQERLKLFAQEREMLLQQQQIIDLERQNAEKTSASLINGMPSWMYPDPDQGNTFNGQAITKDGRNNSVNGISLPPSENYVEKNAMSAEWSTAIEQGVQNSVPAAMESGAYNSIPSAMAQGSSSITQAMLDAFRQQQMNPAASNPEDQYNTNRQRFATGGPVGTDTIPAWLSPGEFVVNSQATKQNFNWLQAINSGRGNPRFADGGPVTNTQMFNNTFNVTSRNPNAQMSVIAGTLRRQMSQGKVTLTKGKRPY